MKLKKYCEKCYPYADTPNEIWYDIHLTKDKYFNIRQASERADWWRSRRRWWKYEISMPYVNFHPPLSLFMMWKLSASSWVAIENAERYWRNWIWFCELLERLIDSQGFWSFLIKVLRFWELKCRKTWRKRWNFWEKYRWIELTNLIRFVVNQNLGFLLNNFLLVVTVHCLVLVNQPSFVLAVVLLVPSLILTILLSSGAFDWS